MGNIARPEDVRNSKKAASQLLARLLLLRHATKRSKSEAAQDLQDLYRVPERDEGSAPGDFWLKVARGVKVLGDETLSRVAHEAILRGQITCLDYPLLELNAGGVRLLRMIGNLLIEAHAGTPMSTQKVEENMAAWERARTESNKRRSEARTELRERLATVSREVTSALQSVDELLSALKASEYCEVQCWHDGSHFGTLDEGPYTSPGTRCLNLLDALRTSLAVGRDGIAGATVQEKDLAGLADLPRFEPQGPNIAASLDFMSNQVLDLIAVEWTDDNEDGEIVVEDLGDCLEPLPSGSDVKPLVWIRTADDPRIEDSLKLC